MSFTPIVNSDNITDILAYQYAGSTNLQDYIKVLLAPFDELEQVFADILNYRMFDTATTDALDVWGVLLNQPRLAYDTTDVPFFGLDADDEFNPVIHKGLGDLDDLSIGGVLRSTSQPIAEIAELKNNNYKDVLCGKRHKNNYKGGTEALISAISAITGFTEKGSFQVEEVFDDPTDPYVRIIFYKELDAVQQLYFNTMDVLPKPGGVRFEYSFAAGIAEVTSSDGLTITDSLGNTIISRSVI